MKFIFASVLLSFIALGSIAFAANSATVNKSPVRQNLSGLTDSANDPNIKQSVARNETTAGVVKTGFYCATCGKWVTEPPILANTNPDAAPANLFKDKKNGAIDL